MRCDNVGPEKEPVAGVVGGEDAAVEPGEAVGQDRGANFTCFDLQAGKLDQGRSPVDEAWHRVVQLVLAPHPELEPSQRAVIESDYGMHNGECVLECRQAVVFYVLKQLDLLDEALSRSPEQQQIVLKNRSDLAKWLPKSRLR